MKWTILKQHEGYMIRSYLKEVHGFSRKLIKSIKFNGGAMLVNGQRKTVRHKLSEGEELSILFPAEVKSEFMKSEPMPLDIVYEDDDIVVISKPAGIATIPSGIHTSGTLANGLLYHYEQHDVPYTVHVVTRLDRDTSGLLLVAKHRYSHSILSTAQKTGMINRHYQAIVEGHPPEQAGTIRLPIGRKEGSIIERAVREDGKDAITHYQVSEEIDGHSLIQVKLETGRTHQIRVHFSHLGNPLAGDDLYGGSQKWMERQALHCDYLAFPHPVTKKGMEFTIPLAQDMLALLRQGRH
ncbi:RluA family pseudouridine synthase [Virgibacillus siamensis]|uniref:RluA family pseudouridine synthase n=1 Tax=Virgibacillus siamensis TaxID=480071 RepID=UPI001FEBB57E|nr:RluA family pseudouridine synthase [Virgibacillus siamensis]